MMRRFTMYTLLMVSLSSIGANVQQKLSKGASLLFKKVNTRLSVIKKNEIFNSTGFILAPDGKQFLMSEDPTATSFPFSVAVYPTDLNKDGIEEIFLLFGNHYTSGKTGSNVLLFVRNQSGNYDSNFGFSGTMPLILPSYRSGFPDIMIGGPDTLYPVWRWNGKEYSHHRNISQKQRSMVKTQTVLEASKAYIATIK